MNWECSLREVVYHILPELKLRKIFLQIEIIQVLLSENKSNKTWNIRLVQLLTKMIKKLSDKVIQKEVFFL